jgi:dolichyl-phosphate-mannose--protein O-mannosyl transferase
MVERRTVNPHHFAYGGLQYYVQAVVAITPALVYARIFDSEPSTLDPQAHNQWRDRQRGRMIQMARAVSALMSALVVCITFVIGTILFDKGVGYLAALLLAVSKSFVAIAHFATVDSAANFWYWLSCLFALLLWKRGNRRWYGLAAITAGFAIGTKVDRLVILFPLLVSHFLRREGLQLRKLFLFAILIPASFVLANPTLITAPFEFLDGVTRDLYFIIQCNK